MRMFNTVVVDIFNCIVVVDVFNCIVVVDDVEVGPDIPGYAKGGNIARRKM